MHIVSKRKDLTLEEALKMSDGLAVLGFFIEVTILWNSMWHDLWRLVQVSICSHLMTFRDQKRNVRDVQRTKKN